MHLKLASKYTVFSCCALLFTMFFFAIFHIDEQNKNFLNEAIYDADALSEMLLRTTYHQMLEDDRQQLQKVIDEAGSMERIQRIRVLGREGLVNFSTKHDEIGTTLNNKDGSCVFCHFREDKVLLNTSAKDRSRVFVGDSGEEVLGMAKGIYNEESCYTAECHFHSPEEKKLGVLDVVISLDKMNTIALDHYTSFFVSAFLMLLSLSGFHYIFTQIYVCKPLNTLMTHTDQLARGNLNVRIEKLPRDEFGELCKSFNLMAHNLGQAQHELHDWASTLEHKVEERTAEINAMQLQMVRTEKLASLGELVAGIAHEINNPLTGIMVFSNLLLEDERLHQDLHKDLETIHRETDRCSAIVRRLLTFSRESTPQKAMESAHVLLENTLSLLEKQPIFKAIELVRDFADELPSISLDGNQISQVFMNILLNAVQAMPEGGTLTLKTEQVDSLWILVSFQDSGEGISTEDLERIFDPFFTTKEIGTGLGLSVSYGIIENHGGKIEADSKIGEGTLFSIYLPLEEKTLNAATDVNG